MWARLSAQHLQNAGENQHILQQRFFEYQIQPDHDIMSHITEIETMAIQLHDVGAPVTPLQIMTKSFVLYLRVIVASQQPGTVYQPMRRQLLYSHLGY